MCALLDEDSSELSTAFKMDRFVLWYGDIINKYDVRIREIFISGNKWDGFTVKATPPSDPFTDVI